MFKVETNQPRLPDSFGFPARIPPETVATILGFERYAIPILDKVGLLKHLGNPKPNAPKWYATAEVLTNSVDRDWLDKASRALSRHLEKKNNKFRQRKELTAMKV